MGKEQPYQSDICGTETPFKNAELFRLPRRKNSFSQASVYYKILATDHLVHRNWI